MGEYPHRVTIEFRGVTLHRPGRDCALGDMTWRGGNSYAVVGETASGKSSLGRFLAGISSPIEVSGDLFVDGVRISVLSDALLSRTVAFLPSNPQLVFSGIRGTVRDEALLTLQFLNTPEQLAREMLASCAETLGIGKLLDRDPFTLSGGESALAALAVCVVKRPGVIVLDQAYDSLDPHARLHLRDSLRSLEAAGTLIIELHNRTPPWVDSYDSCVFLKSPDAITGPYAKVAVSVASLLPWLLPPAARLLRDFEEAYKVELGRYPADEREAAGVLRECVVIQPIDTIQHAGGPGDVVEARPPALVVANLRHRYATTAFLLGPVACLKVSPGELISLIGPNGAGKTTLLRALSLLLDPEYDRMQAATRGSQDLRSPLGPKRRHEWARSVMYCFQHPGDQLCASTVRSEVIGPARLTGGLEPDRFDRYVELLGLNDVLAARPVDLPAPLQKLVTIAACLIAAPPVVLLDEPTAGLDERQVSHLGKAVQAHLAAGGGCLMVSHDVDFVCDYSTRLIAMDGGKARPLSIGKNDLKAVGFLPTVARLASYLDPPVAAVRAGQLRPVSSERE